MPFPDCFLPQMSTKCMDLYQISSRHFYILDCFDLLIRANINQSMGLMRRAVTVALIVAIASVVGSVVVVDGAKSKVKFVRKTVSSHEIVIFSKSYCPYCRRAKGVFQELNKVPHVVELDQREDGGDIQNALSEIVGRRTVPQVFINGKHLGGSDDTVEAYESGELAKLLNISSQDDL